MQETKAISPEIKGLFDTIKIQAAQYADAFDQFDNTRKEFEEFSAELRKIHSDLYTKTNSELNNYSEIYDDLINLIKNEYSKVHLHYQELSDLKKLQDSYFETLQKINNLNITVESQSSELKTYFAEYSELVESLKKSSETKVDEFLSDSLSRIDEVVKTKYQKFENQITTKIRKIDGKVISNDAMFYSLQDQYSNDFKSILREIDSFKKAIIQIELSKNNPNDPSSQKSFINEFDIKMHNIDQKVKTLNDRLDNVYKNLKNNSISQSGSDDSNSNAIFRSSVVINTPQIYQINNLITVMNKKITTIMGLSIAALIISVIAFVLTFII